MCLALFVLSVSVFSLSVYEPVCACVRLQSLGEIATLCVYLVIFLRAITYSTFPVSLIL